MEHTIVSTAADFYENSGFDLMSSIIKYIKLSLKIVLNTIFCFLLLISILISIVFIDSKINKLRGRNTPLLANAYVIVSESMTPTIKVQDAVIIFRANPEKLKVGDIITFKSVDPRYDGYIITHRINKIVTMENGEPGFITKGDNNNVVDNSIVTGENVYGKVLVKLPYLGFLQQLMFKPYGLLLFVVLPCLLISLFYIVKTIYINKSESRAHKNFGKNVLSENKILINEYGNDIEIEII